MNPWGIFSGSIRMYLSFSHRDNNKFGLTHRQVWVTSTLGHHLKKTRGVITFDRTALCCSSDDIFVF